MIVCEVFVLVTCEFELRENDSCFRVTQSNTIVKQRSFVAVLELNVCLRYALITDEMRLIIEHIVEMQ